MRLRAARIFVFGSLAAVAVAACSGGGVSSVYQPPATHPSPAASTTAASPSPNPVTQSVAVMQVSNGPITGAPVPAPTGYTSKLSIPNATVPANTSITVTSSSSFPANSAFPPLSSARRAGLSTRMPQATGSGYATIFFDSITPSNPITVAGTISATQAFPAGTLVSTTMYYLGFYDPTQTNPAWQTIASTTPNSDGVTLAFSGNAGSVTLAAGKTYGFAIFTIPAGSTATPPPAPAVLAYIPQNAAGIVEVNAAGVTATTLPITANSLGLDDGGNIYALNPSQAAAPASSSAPSPTAIPATLAKYDAGSSTAALNYTPSQPYNSIFVVSSGAGEVVTFGNPVTSGTGTVTESYDVWNYNSTGGAPSYTITEPSSGIPFGILDHAGNLYTTHENPTGSFQYDVYAPGSSTPTTSIPEKLVPTAQQAQFNPNYAAVGFDGTLYVTEFCFCANDPLAGLYIYKPNSSGSGYTETKVATTSTTPTGAPASDGPGPEGVDIDANNDIYVANANYANSYDANGNFQQADDQLHDITVYAPGGTSVIRHITGSFEPVPLAVAADGTLFFSSFGQADGTGTQGSFSVMPGTSTVTQVAANPATLFALFDGSRETTGVRRIKSATFSGSAGRFGIGPTLARRLQALRSLRRR